VCIAHRAASTRRHAAHFGFDNTTNGDHSDLAALPGIQNNWQWGSTEKDTGVRLTIDVTTTGNHTINMYSREAGLTVDQIELTTSSTYEPLKIINPGFESGTDPGATNWVFVGGAAVNAGSGGTSQDARKAYMQSAVTDTQSITQTLRKADGTTAASIPTGCVSTLSYSTFIDGADSTTIARDTFVVEINDGGTWYTVATLSNADDSTGWVSRSTGSLAAYEGATQIRFTGTFNNSLNTTFRVDGVFLTCN
jgi:hypothetical protein